MLLYRKALLQNKTLQQRNKDGDPALSCFSMRDSRLNYTVKIIAKSMQ